MNELIKKNMKTILNLFKKNNDGLTPLRRSQLILLNHYKGQKAKEYKINNIALFNSMEKIL